MRVIMSLATEQHGREGHRQAKWEPLRSCLNLACFRINLYRIQPKRFGVEGRPKHGCVDDNNLLPCGGLPPRNIQRGKN